MTAAEAYAARVDAANAQRARARAVGPAGDFWSGTLARRFRQNPHRAIDPNLAIVASYVQPDDVVVDVGGGAGRVCLPLALRCREVFDVDPSAGMRSEFEACAAEANITNARFVQSDWLAAEGISADVVLAANVTYFVRDIVPFVRKMDRAARRRVMITVWSVPPASQDAALFEVLHGEKQAPAPGYRELLPVLWEMDILPDVRVLPNPFREGSLPRTRDDAVDWAALRLHAEDKPAVRAMIVDRFDDLFAESAAGFRPLWRPDARELLITWEPHV